MSILQIYGQLIKSPRTSSIDFSGKKIYFNGDSITVGAYADTTNNRWTSKLTTYLGAIEVNLGITSTGLPDMLSKLSEIPTKTSDDALLVFAFGMNDWGRYQESPATFKANFQTVITNALSKGWPANRIFLLSASYPLDAAFPFYAATFSVPEPTRQQMLDLVQATKEVAEENELIYYNMYNAMLANNPVNLVTGSDGVHPTTAGHAFMGLRIYNYLSSIII